MDKKSLSEQDIRTKFITPAIVQHGGWDVQTQVREEVGLTKGRVIVRGKLVSRARPKRADYVLYRKPGIPIAVVEAKDNNHTVGDGMQQALGYAEMLDVPFAYSSNGDAFLEHDHTVKSGDVERQIALDAFPSPAELWQRYRADKNFDDPGSSSGQRFSPARRAICPIVCNPSVSETSKKCTPTRTIHHANGRNPIVPIVSDRDWSP